MSRELNLVWDWPMDGELPGEVRSWVDQVLGNNSARYTLPNQVIMSFPGTAVHPIAAEVCRRLVAEHPNNIGLHTAGVSEEGFQGSQEAEVRGIRWLGRILGDAEADGYFNSGGTEANIMGLWIGRNMLRAEYGDPLDRRICVFTSFLTHYSVRKACDVLDLGEGDYHPCTECQILDHFFHPEKDGSGLHFVPTDRFGAISEEPESVDGISSLANLRRQIEKKIGQGFKRFMLVANAGTTMTGGVDDIPAIGRMIRELGIKHPDVGFYLHVDAAFGGFVGPFIDPPIACGFAHPAVQSVTVDPHKMGLTPYPCGGFLCRKGLATKWVKRDVGYIGGHLDCTVTGSRSGTAAVAASLLFQYLDKEGYNRIVQNCMAVTEGLREALVRNPRIEILPSKLNILPMALDSQALKDVLFEHNLLARKEEEANPGQKIDNLKLCESLPSSGRELAEKYFRLQRKYTLMGEWLPKDLGDLKSHPRRIHKIVVMPHSWVRNKPAEVIAAFADELGQLLI